MSVKVGLGKTCSRPHISPLLPCPCPCPQAGKKRNFLRLTWMDLHPSPIPRQPLPPIPRRWHQCSPKKRTKYPPTPTYRTLISIFRMAVSEPGSLYLG